MNRTSSSIVGYSFFLLLMAVLPTYYIHAFTPMIRIQPLQSYHSFNQLPKSDSIFHCDRPTSNTATPLYAKNPNEDPDLQNVNVNIVDDVDPFTLTAIGFAAIAFNFLVFANMGDSGIGGLVARIINTFN